MMDHEASMMAANSIDHHVRQACEQIVGEYTLPCVVYRPKLFRDGNQWCALYGEDLQHGVAGFGKSPEKAMRNFCLEWNKEIA